MLVDQFSRTHDYLRISLTEHCNFRCLYCMPNEKYSHITNENLMQADEIFKIASVFVDLGVKKIRLTGGEPLVRKDFAEIVRLLSGLPVELTLTTNGYLLDNYLTLFKQYGIKSLNISLDSLKQSTFKSLTQRDHFHKVWENIMLFVNNGFHVKLNAVILKDINEQEVFDLVELTKNQPLHIRFIEFMPFNGNSWDKGKMVNNETLLNKIKQKFSLIKLKDEHTDTAKKYGISKHMGTIAFISSLSDSFCSTCNRLRLTADGKMKNCLFGKEEIDILSTYRLGQDIVPLIKSSVQGKHKMLGGQFVDYQNVEAGHLNNRSMIQIGG